MTIPYCLLCRRTTEMDQIGKTCFIAMLFLFSFDVHRSSAADTISLGRSLFGNQTIVSSGGMFELGFFKPGNSHNFYLGIWYKKIPGRTVVWVANRDEPFSNIGNLELKIANDGNLVLVQSQILVWSSNVPSSISGSTVAVLLDSGNFVLRNMANSSDVFWQSFDHPTDTWLPTQRFGLNKITGENQLITSWRNSEDPSTGLFALGLEPNGTDRLLLWRNGTKYWDSGPWNGESFAVFSGMERNYLTYDHVSNEREDYFTYTPINVSSVARVAIDVDGQNKLIMWLEESQEWLWVCLIPSDPCSVPSLCGGFSSCNPQALPFCGCLEGFEPGSANDWRLGDWSGGCVRRTPLQCNSTNSSNGETDHFRMISDIQLPINPRYLAVASTGDCELACLNDCSCMAYAYSHLCLIWNDTLYDLKQLSSGSSDGGESGNLHLRLAASEFPNYVSGRRQSISGIFIGAGAGFVVLLIIAAAFLWKFRTRNFVGSLEGSQGTLVAFRYKDLLKATDNFSEVLGQGGFGTVFKGTLPDSTDIAVKKLAKHVQGEKQFRAEVSTIGLIRHVNLVSLRGFCSEGSERLLVYDYMPNGSLGFHLFRNECKPLDWTTRHRIAIGIARGLAYLHENCRDCIIHCDVKPENILLDEEFSPKVADFGLAKLVGREFSGVLTTLRGTLGYLAPEWISGVAITQKADVYSYGMMLLEVLSGRRNATQSEDESFSFFPITAAEKVEEDDDILSLLDCKLEGKADVDELRRACRVSIWCIQDEEKHRPTMRSVVQILEGHLAVDIPPIPKILQRLVSDQDSYLLYEV